MGEKELRRMRAREKGIETAEKKKEDTDQYICIFP